MNKILSMSNADKYYFKNKTGKKFQEMMSYLEELE